jgi:hypothetical protein
MYLGGNFCKKVSRSNENETFETGFSRPSNDVICLRIESLIMMTEGEKLNAEPEEVGVGLPQFTAQHS